MSSIKVKGGKQMTLTQAETRELVECHECGAHKFKSRMYRVELYDSPFDDKPHTAYVCKRTPNNRYGKSYNWMESCEEVLSDTGWADFRYFTCEGCGRLVCEQSPSNGWHTQYRIVNECEQVCLRCYEENILENGVERKEFEEGHLPGMFFSGDNSEPLDAGYEIVEGFYNYHIGNEKPVLAKALELIDSGHKVIVGYESMAIGGLGGYITLFAKS